MLSDEFAAALFLHYSPMVTLTSLPALSLQHTEVELYYGRSTMEEEEEGVEMQLSQYQHQSIHLYQALVMSVLLYSAETWTLLAADMKTLEAFHMRCQRQILGVCWWAHVSNAEVLQRSGLSATGDILRHRRLSLFDHVARLDPGVPAHDALRLTVDTYEGRRPMASWRRPPPLETSGPTRSRPTAIYAVEI